MALQYRLMPPFLHVPEEDSFADMWEAFCCKLLNIEYSTTEIFRRNPPEQGIDLFYPSGKIAYQCKSIESGKSGDFNVSHAVASYNAALKVQATLGWEVYALCTNVAVTGTAEASLRSEIPNLTLLPESHWIQLCEANSIAAASNFRVVVDVQPRHISYGNELLDVSAAFSEPDLIHQSSFNLLLYCNRHDRVYRLPVHGDMSVERLLRAMKDLFLLPDRRTFSDQDISVSLSHALVVEGRKIPLNRTLTEAGLEPDSLLTYWTQIIIQDNVKSKSFRGDVIHMMTTSDLARPRPHSERRELALKQYNAQITKCFSDTDVRLTQV